MIFDVEFINFSTFNLSERNLTKKKYSHSNRQRIRQICISTFKITSYLLTDVIWYRYLINVIIIISMKDVVSSSNGRRQHRIIQIRSMGRVNSFNSFFCLADFLSHGEHIAEHHIIQPVLLLPIYGTSTCTHIHSNSHNNFFFLHSWH